MNQMLYSLRSIEMYAPWIRKIFIVTNGQKPNWLNLNKSRQDWWYSKKMQGFSCIYTFKSPYLERIELVLHTQIFQNHSHLPTFNSAAIETHLHRIPGLSRRFIYFNDDFSLQSPVSLTDFWTEENGYKIYRNGPVISKARVSLFIK